MRYDDDYYDLPPLSREPSHSGIGIASFLIAIASGISMFIIFAIAAVLQMDGPGLDQGSETLIGCGVLLAMFGSLIGAGLGIGGCFQSNRKTIFAILGLVFNGMILLGIGLLMVIGIAMGGG